MKRLEILGVLVAFSLVAIIVFQQYQISGLYGQNRELALSNEQQDDYYADLLDKYNQLNTTLNQLQHIHNQLNASFLQLLSSMEKVAIETVTGDSSTDEVTVYAKSVGGRDVEITDFILKDATGHTLGIQSPSVAWTLPSTAETKTTTLTFSGSLTSGAHYTLILVTKLGNTFESSIFTASEPLGQEKVSIIAVTGEGTSDTVEIYAKSVGGDPVTITDVVLKDSTGATLGVVTLGTPVALPADGATTLVSATFTGLMTVGEYYTVTLVTTLGNTFVSPTFKAS